MKISITTTFTGELMVEVVSDGTETPEEVAKAYLETLKALKK